MNLKDLIEDFLLSKLSKRLLTIAVLLAGAPFLLPESVIAEINWTPKAQLWLLKSTVSLALLLLGACAILIIEINARLNEATSAESARVFDHENGIWKDLKNGLFYCPKCKTSPLKTIGEGWYCAFCNTKHESAEYRKKENDRKSEAATQFRARNSGGWMG